MTSRLEPDSQHNRHNQATPLGFRNEPAFSRRWLRCLRSRRPQHMTGITAGMLNEIFLVVIFGGVKFSRRGDLGCDWPVEFARFIPPGFYCFRRLLLRFARIEDSRTILRANVVVLSVERGRIMHAE